VNATREQEVVGHHAVQPSYLVSGFRGSFFGTADVGVGISVGMTFLFLLLCLGGVVWIFRTGYKLKA
jgi:ABC-2 type transport system permease protein